MKWPLETERPISFGGCSGGCWLRRWPLLITDNEEQARLKPNEQIDLLSTIEKNRSTLGRSADRLARVILSCMASPFELHREVKRGNTRRVRELLATGAEINAKDRSGYTPLMHALQSPAASAELVEFLLDSGGEVAAITLDGTDCYMASVAIERRGPDQAGLGARPRRGPALYEEHGYDALLDAAYGLYANRDPRSLDILKMLIARGVQLNTVSSYRESALRVLSRWGRFDGVRLLLDAGADETQLAWMPLHRAVALGSLDDVRDLVERGADLEAVDWWKRSPWLVSREER